jgi:hypothetical protein
MRFASVAWFGLIGLAYADPAFALTINNNDAKAHNVTITQGGKANKLTVEPQKGVDAGCASGCTVKLDNGEEYQLKGGETVSIDDGALFIDVSPDATAEGLPNLDPDTVPDEPADEEDTNDDSDDADQDAPPPE